MLVLSRKPGEKILIGDNITVTVVEVVGNRVRIALDAPPHVSILRSELVEGHDRAPVVKGPPKRPRELERATPSDREVQPHLVVSQ